MRRVYQFAGNHPVYFVLLLLLLWVFVGAIAVILISLLFNLPITAYTAQSLGTLTATAVLLIITWRFGWLRPAGITSLGTWKAWLYALAALVYLVLVYWLVFFGEIAFDPAVFSRSGEASAIILRQVIVGLVEEIVFRGVVLYALVRVWGKSRRMLAASVILAAFLFGSFHLLQGFGGSSFNTALLVSVESFVSAVWWGAIVLIGISIWPTVVIHTVSNLSVLIRLLTLPGFVLSGSGFVLVALFQLPLVIIFMWLLLRSFPRPDLPESPRFADGA
jgi:membrane protease YdiL (CAAX protease family)